MTPEAYRPVSYLEWNAARRPRAAAVWDGRDISFEELLAHVRSYQRWLAAQGVVAGDVVGVRLPNVWQYVALELAIPDLGAVILPLPLHAMLLEPRWTAGRCIATARDARATVMVGVPTNVIRMLNHDVPLPAVRAVAVAGAPLPPEIAERWERSTGIAISSFYGSMDAGQLAVGSPSDPREKRWTTVGRPHDAAVWKILDSGEICMRGDLVQQRYWGERSGPYSDD